MNAENIQNTLNTVALFTANQITSLLKNLKESQIVQIQVMDKLANDEYLLFFKGNSFNAKSAIPLNKGQTILAKIQSLEPNIVLNMIPMKDVKQNDSVYSYFKNQLTNINILPSDKNINIAKAFFSEQIPLKIETFNKFSNEINKLDLSEYPNIQTAAKLFKNNIPLTLNLVEEFSKNLSETNVANLSGQEQIRNINSLYSKLPLPLQEQSKTILGSFEQVVENISVNQNSSPKELFKALTDSIYFSGNSYEKNFLSSLANTFLNKEAFVENTPKIVEKLDVILQALKSLPQQTPAKSDIINNFASMIESTKDYFSELKNELTKVFSEVDKAVLGSSEKTPVFQPSNNTLINLIHSFDKLIYEIKLNPDVIKLMEEINSNQNSSAVSTGKISDEIQNVFSNFFSNKNLSFKETFVEGNVFNSIINKPEIEAKIKANQFSETKEALTSINLPNNLKQFVYSLKELIANQQNEAASKDRAQSNLNNNLQKELDNLLNNIQKEQFNRLSDSSMEKMIPINLLFSNENESKDIELFFKKQTSDTSKGTKQDSYSVFFSMNLSSLGYFEVSVLEKNKALDITFFSSNKTIRKFFDTNKNELNKKLEEISPIANVRINVAEPKDNSNLRNESAKITGDFFQKSFIDILS